MYRTTLDIQDRYFGVKDSSFHTASLFSRDRLYPDLIIIARWNNQTVSHRSTVLR
jgi:hypothetical protein